jgi:hypothetical protein
MLHLSASPIGTGLRRIRQRCLVACGGFLLCVVALVVVGEWLRGIRWPGWVSVAVFVACALVAWRLMVCCGNLWLNSRCPRCGDYFFLKSEVRPRAFLELTRGGPCGSCGLPIRGDGGKGR